MEEKKLEEQGYEITTESASLMCALKTLDEADNKVREVFDVMYGESYGEALYKKDVESHYEKYKKAIEEYLTFFIEQNLPYKQI